MSVSGNYGKEHSTSWNSGTTYNIKCENQWGKMNNQCTVVNLASLG